MIFLIADKGVEQQVICRLLASSKAGDEIPSRATKLIKERDRVLPVWLLAAIPPATGIRMSWDHRFCGEADTQAGWMLT